MAHSIELKLKCRILQERVSQERRSGLLCVRERIGRGDCELKWFFWVWPDEVISKTEVAIRGKKDTRTL